MNLQTKYTECGSRYYRVNQTTAEKYERIFGDGTH